MNRYFMIRIGNWILNDWHLYHFVTVKFGNEGQYTRKEWRKIL